MELKDKLIDYQGKPYLPVVWRVVEFRNKFESTYGIETSIQFTQNSVIATAKIVMFDSGKVLAMGHKSKPLNQNDAVAKAETGAIGRALSFFGIGTELATQDLEEGDDVVDKAVAQQTTVPEMVKTPGISGGSKLDQFNNALKQAPNLAPQAPQTDSYQTQYDKTGGVKLVSVGQVKRLWAIAISKKISAQEVNRMLADSYGFTDPKKLNWKQYNDFIKFLESCEAVQEEPPMPTEMPADLVEQMNEIPF